MVVGSSGVVFSESLFTSLRSGKGVVEKVPGEAFTIEITFRNTGNTLGVWSVNLNLEGDKWNWNETAQTLALNTQEVQTLTWSGTVPKNASINSFARLIAYFDDSFEALDSWIHVVSKAKLTTVTSRLK